MPCSRLGAQGLHSRCLFRLPQAHCHLWASKPCLQVRRGCSQQLWEVYLRAVGWCLLWRLELLLMVVAGWSPLWAVSARCLSRALRHGSLSGRTLMRS